MNETIVGGTACRGPKNVIGRGAIVRLADGVLVGAIVIDAVAGENRSKRVRLQTGEHAGEVRTMGEYTLMEFTD